MKAIPKLKDDARKFEQKEEWEKAIQAYLQVLQIGEEGDGADLDLPLYNRVGDLYVRLGRPSDAVTYYEKAADRYAEAGLYNNAIALCNKALRYDAGKLELTRKLGMFSASQGFFTDARRWYLEFAEKAIKRGQLDDAFAALTDYANVNDEADIRELLARQLRDHGRKEQAVEEFKRAYALRTAAGQHAEAEAVRGEMHAIDPNADVTDAPAAQAPSHSHPAYEQEDQLPGFVDLDQVQPAAPEPPPIAARAAAAPAAPPEELAIEPTAIEGGMDASDEGADYGSITIESGFAGADIDDVETVDIGLEASLGVEPEEVADSAFDLPLIGEEEAEPEEAMALPTFDDFAEEPEAAQDAGELPMLTSEDDVSMFEPLPGFDGVEAEAEQPMVETEFAAAPELSTFAFAEPEAEPELAAEAEAAPEAELASFEPEPEPEAAATMNEPPALAGIDFSDLDFGEAMMAPPPPPASVMPPPAPAAAPARKRSDYVDLAALLSDEEEQAEDSTRFVVAEKPPTGDEDKDFADMLAQFKEKVAESIPKEDAGSHYDLGIAFKEMGLVDEAIGEFQTALRAGQEKLKVYEELGSCFVIKGQFSVAITVLNRAQQMPHRDDQELLGVYYNLGRAYEELGQRAEAKAAFEKILAIDISFMDTTTRVARL